MKRYHKPNPISLKQIEKLNAEVPARVALAERCGGKSVVMIRTVYHNGKPYELNRVYCLGGTCECGCGESVLPWECRLHPHEKLPRSRGGLVSLENSLMVLNKCHRRLQDREPRLQWIGGRP